MHQNIHLHIKIKIIGIPIFNYLSLTVKMFCHLSLNCVYWNLSSYCYLHLELL